MNRFTRSVFQMNTCENCDKPVKGSFKRCFNCNKNRKQYYEDRMSDSDRFHKLMQETFPIDEGYDFFQTPGLAELQNLNMIDFKQRCKNKKNTEEFNNLCYRWDNRGKIDDIWD